MHLNAFGVKLVRKTVDVGVPRPPRTGTRWGRVRAGVARDRWEAQGK